MNIHGIEIGVAGFYSFYLNGELVQECPVKNLITDFGWNRLFALTFAATAPTQIQLGTSNTPPTLADTVLGAFLVSKDSSNALTHITGTDTVGTYRGHSFTYVFAQGAVVGNVAEVGWKVASGDAALTSRSLVKDGAGNPAVITVTAIDQLTVVYQLRFYLNRTLTNTGSVTVAGTPTTWTIMAAANDVPMGNASVQGYTPTSAFLVTYGNDFVMGAVGTNPTGTFSTYTLTLTSVTANASTGVITSTYTFAVDDANQTGGLFGLTFNYKQGAADAGHLGKYKMSFSPAIPKTNTKTLALTTTITIVRL